MLSMTASWHGPKQWWKKPHDIADPICACVCVSAFYMCAYTNIYGMHIYIYLCVSGRNSILLLAQSLKIPLT